MSIFKIVIGVGIGFLFLIILLVNIDFEIFGPTEVNLIGLNESEIFLGEGDLCAPYSGPKCKNGLICQLHPTFPDADGVCIKPNVTGVYNIRN